MFYSQSICGVVKHNIRHYFKLKTEEHNQTGSSTLKEQFDERVCDLHQEKKHP